MKVSFCLQWILLACSIQAATTYKVTVNTASLNGSVGFLDLQFNPVNATSQPATATITSFAGGAVSAAQTSVHRHVTGTVLGAVTMLNLEPFQELYQRITYRNSFSFLLTLSGDAIDSPSGQATAGSTFGISLYNANQRPTLTNQGAATGFAGQVEINLDGTTTPTGFNAGPGARPVITFQLVATAP